MPLNLSKSMKIICEQRRIKSDAKVTMYQQASTLSNFAINASIVVTQTITFEDDILTTMQGFVF